MANSDTGLKPGSRIEAFSDALFAIVMTVLVLNLQVPQVPDGATNLEYLMKLLTVAPTFLALVASFVMILVFVVNHHNLFTSLQKIDEWFMWFNGLLLLFITIIPFPTKFISQHPAAVVPVVLYALNLFLCMLAFGLLTNHSRRKKLYKPELQSEYASMRSNRSIPGLVLYLASIPLAFVNTYISIAIFVLVPIIYFLPAQFDLFAAFKKKAERHVRR